MFRTERRSPEFLARWISAVTIFPSEGARDPLSEAALAEAFEKGGWQDITGLCRARTCRKTLLASRALDSVRHANSRSARRHWEPWCRVRGGKNIG